MLGGMECEGGCGKRGSEVSVSLVLAFFRDDELLEGGGALAEVFANDGGRRGEVRVK
jgi:hypothetical protein